MKKWTFVALLLVGATILGATVFREPIAWAAQSVDATIIGPLDNGNVRIHEEGTAAVRSADEEVSFTKGFASAEGTCVGIVYTVPAGKELVVEYISGKDFGPGSTAAGGIIFNFPSATQLLPLVFQEAEPGQFVASEGVHYVFPAGTDVGFAGERKPSSGCSFVVSLGGYLQPSS